MIRPLFRFAAVLPIAIALAGATAAPANADESVYLQLLRAQYWTRSYSDGQLLKAGYWVCDNGNDYSDVDLASDVATAFGISQTAGAVLVGAARGGLGC